MKKLTIVILILLLFSSYNYFQPNTFSESLPFFTLKDTFINKQPVWQVDVAGLLDEWGAPEKISQYSVYAHASETPNILNILEYHDIQFEVLLDSSYDSDINSKQILRYDITGPSFALKDIYVGLSMDEFIKTYSDYPLYGIEILSTSSDELEKKFSDNLYSCIFIKKLLCDYKPDGYYNEYDYAAYVDGAVLPDELQFYSNMTTSIGAVILFEDDKVSRIVFGFPNAN
ncbi:MAG: hypothetical protein ACOX81_01315 [Candidatus Heteroscillospira sp.]|jgi:hypothetical protein